MTMVANNRGSAMIETLPLLIIFVVLLSFGIGLFGVVHTGIMNSMAARTYAFESFSNRADVSLFRDRAIEGSVFLQHNSAGNRFHTINSELDQDDNSSGDILATTRNIAFGRKIASSEASEQDHNVKIYDISGRNRRGVEASPAWVMVGYGLCTNARCGD